MVMELFVRAAFGTVPHAGRVPTPCDRRTWFTATAVIRPIAFEALAANRSPVVAAFGRVSVDQRGAAPTPPLRRYDPTATSASGESDWPPAVEYRMSPVAVGVPTRQVLQVSVREPPRETVPPPPTGAVVLMVTELLVSEPLPMLVSVLEAPLIVLFVSVSVVARPTMVSVASGRVSVLVVLGFQLRVPSPTRLSNEIDFVVPVPSPTTGVSVNVCVPVQVGLNP